SPVTRQQPCASDGVCFMLLGVKASDGAVAPGMSVAAGGIMVRLSRRRFGRGALAASAATLMRAPAGWAQKDLHTLRFVPEAALTILDPIWTTGYVTRNYGYLVYDTLFGMDENFNIKPQMVERTTVSSDGMKYTFTLRDGLRWHDGLPV